MPPRATRPRIRYRPSTSAPISESVTVVSIGRQCRRRNAALAHADRYGCSTVPPAGGADGLGVTEGDGGGDVVCSGVGLADCGVGTGAGHGQVDVTAGATAGASAGRLAAACRTGARVTREADGPTGGRAAGAPVPVDRTAGAPPPSPGTAEAIGDSRAPSPPATATYTAAIPAATSAPSPTAAYQRRGGRWYASYSGYRTSVGWRDGLARRATS